MKPDTTPVAVGDWVYSDSPGIWRGYRIIQDVKRARFNLQERQRMDRRPLIFGKRLVDESWKPAFTNDFASIDFVHPLSDEDRRRLAEFIANNPQIMRDFEAFEPSPINRAMDLPMNIPASVEKEEVQRLIRDVFSGIGDEGLTNDAILQRISANELARYAPKTIRNATLQFLCKDHEIRDDEYVFREVQLIMV